MTPRPYQDNEIIDCRVNMHSFHLVIEEMCQVIANQDTITSSISTWTSTSTHIYYGSLFLYRLIAARIEANVSSAKERNFHRVFKTKIGTQPWTESSEAKFVL